jgi:hypothetical protein
MEWIDANSSNLSSYAYDKQNKQLHIRFVKAEDKVYVFKNVSEKEFSLFDNSSSKGSHFHAYIRNSKSFTIQ